MSNQSRVIWWSAICLHWVIGQRIPPRRQKSPEEAMSTLCDNFSVIKSTLQNQSCLTIPNNCQSTSQYYNGTVGSEHNPAVTLKNTTNDHKKGHFRTNTCHWLNAIVMGVHTLKVYHPTEELKNKNTHIYKNPYACNVKYVLTCVHTRDLTAWKTKER